MRGIFKQIINGHQVPYADADQMSGVFRDLDKMMREWLKNSCKWQMDLR
jgi:hypothetical protein